MCRNVFVAESISRSRIKFYFPQRLHQRCSECFMQFVSQIAPNIAQYNSAFRFKYDTRAISVVLNLNLGNNCRIFTFQFGRNRVSENWLTLTVSGHFWLVDIDRKLLGNFKRFRQKRRFVSRTVLLFVCLVICLFVCFFHSFCFLVSVCIFADIYALFAYWRKPSWSGRLMIKQNLVSWSIIILFYNFESLAKK